MPREANFTFDPANHEALAQALQSRFDHVRQTEESVEFDLLDTFDGRIFGAGAILAKRSDRYILEALMSGQPIAALSVSRRVSFRFAGDFPASPLADNLSALIKMRALLPMAHVRRTRRVMGLLNADQKTVARAVIDLYSLAETDETIGACQLLAVKGYPKAHQVACEAVVDLVLPAQQPPIKALLAQNGTALDSYSKKIDLVLDPQASATETIRLILARLLTIMQVNQAGIIEDIDTEFLHDFRVASRKSRSLLSQVKGVLSPEVSSELQGHLKQLGRMTNNLRDLDVYLLNKRHYAGMLPVWLQPGLVPLFRSIQRRRRAAYLQVCRNMTKPEFEKALDTIRAITERDPAELNAKAGDGQSTLPVAQMVIAKTFRKLIKKGRRITAQSPDEALHKLRIDCKKMRYLLEFFESLFPSETMTGLIKSRKNLQTLLGDFNDLSVQQTFLKTHLEAIRPTGASATLHTAATGGLISQLHQQQQRLRQAFFAVFDQFDDTTVHRKFETICQSTSKEKH